MGLERSPRTLRTVQLLHAGLAAALHVPWPLPAVAGWFCHWHKVMRQLGTSLTWVVLLLAGCRLSLTPGSCGQTAGRSQGRKEGRMLGELARC